MGSIDLCLLQDEKTTSVEKKVKELTDEHGRLQKTNQGLQVYTSSNFKSALVDSHLFLILMQV